jgi:hypothetical protein
VDLDALGSPASPLAQRSAPRRRSGLEQHLGVIGIGIVVLVVFAEALLGQPALAAVGDLDDEVLDVPGGGWEHVDDGEPTLLVLVPDTIGDEAVEVRVEGQRAAELATVLVSSSHRGGSW